MATRNRNAAFSPLNPVHFSEVVSFDYVNKFPSNDNLLSRSEAWYNITSMPYCFNYIVNKTFKFQLHVRGTFNVIVYDIINETANVVSSAQITNVTPAGWAGDYNIYNVNFAFQVVSCYRIFINVTFDGNTQYWESDNIKIVSQSTGLTECIHIQYTHSENRFNFVFTDGTTNQYTGNVYIETDLNDEKGGNTLDTFESDRGDLTILQATPTVLYDVVIYKAPKYFVKFINLLLSLDTIYANNIRVQASNPPEYELNGSTNSNKISFQLQQKDWDYLQDETTELGDPAIFLSDDDDDFISNDSDILIT